jgi:type III pantothenate kinase
MIICLDSGNTRIKWGVHDGARWLGQGAISHAEVSSLAGQLSPWPGAEKILLANVAGVSAAQAIRHALTDWPADWLEVVSETSRCGVSNGYKNPGQLGVDRWCALLGARTLTQSPCVVVMAGTATTIDSLDASGRFLGGFILPGGELMRRALAKDTAGLPFANGAYSAYPQCTDDAIVAGSIEAQVGAIERAVSRLGSTAQCLISGGNAQLLAEHCAKPCRVLENLPLEGLLQLAHDIYPQR